MPYRTLANVVQGAVITFVDITDADDQHAQTHEPKHLLKTSTTYRIPGLERLKVGASLNWQDAKAASLLEPAVEQSRQLLGNENPQTASLLALLGYLSGAATYIAIATFG